MISELDTLTPSEAAVEQTLRNWCAEFDTGRKFWWGEAPRVLWWLQPVRRKWGQTQICGRQDIHEQRCHPHIPLRRRSETRAEQWLARLDDS